MITLNRIKRAIKLIFPSGSIWADKNNGGDLENLIDGFSGQFGRDADRVNSLSNAMIPSLTDYLDEWDAEFFNAPGDLTEAERRGRLEARIKMMFFNKSRIASIQETLRLSGFPTAVIRTLGWFGVNESPFDFFPGTGFAFYGADEAIYNDTDMIYNNTQVVGNALLLTNGGSIDYFIDSNEAVVTLEQNPDYWGAYFVVEAEGQVVLDVSEELKETFFDLLYTLKPAQMHGILRVNFT